MVSINAHVSIFVPRQKIILENQKKGHLHTGTVEAMLAADSLPTQTRQNSTGRSPRGGRSILHTKTRLPRKDVSKVENTGKEGRHTIWLPHWPV